MIHGSPMRFRILLLLACLLATPSISSAMDVLLLHGTDAPTPWTESIGVGVAEELGDPSAVRNEHLGPSTAGEDHFHDIAMILKREMKSRADIVIATDATAVAFTGKYREDLFPDSAVILTGLDRIDPGRLAMCGDCTALPLEVDLDRTLELVFTMRPETRLVVGITDGSQEGQSAKTSLERAMERYEDRAGLIFPGHEPGDDQGLDLDTLSNVLAGIPPKGVGILLRFHEDNRGNPISDEQLVGLFERRIVSPVFVPTDAMLGSGVVGGALVSGRDVGRQAIRLARRILAGEPAREMLPEPVKAKVLFDGTGLARYGMTPPPDATVVNGPKTPNESDEILPGAAPIALAGLFAFAGALYLLRRYSQ